MPQLDLRDAFGKTPDSIKQCVRRSLRQGFQEETEGKIVKKKLSTVLITALLVILAVGTVALAATGFSVTDLFKYVDAQGAEQANEALLELTQPVSADFEGTTVNFSMVDALYDQENGAYALAWTFENKAPDEQLYVVCDSLAFGGQHTSTRGMLYMSEFILPEGKTDGAVMGELEPGASADCEISFSVLRVKGEIVQIEPISDEMTEEELGAQLQQIADEGKLAQARDGYIPVDQAEGQTYTDALIASGKLELADKITLRFTLSDDQKGRKRTYKGDGVFAFEDYELRVTNAEISPMKAVLRVEYITAEEPVIGPNGLETSWYLDFEAPGVEAWTANAGGTFEDPVRLADGRWMIAYNYTAVELYAQPDELVMTLVAFDQDFEPISHADEAVTLKFE